MLPDLFHVIPIRDNAVLQRIPNFQQPSVLFGPSPNKYIPFQSTCENSGMFRPADEGREEAFGRVLASEASSNRTTAIIEHYGRIVEGFRHDIWVQEHYYKARLSSFYTATMNNVYFLRHFMSWSDLRCRGYGLFMTDRGT